MGLGSLRLAFFLSADRRRRFERWLRGQKEYHRLQEADIVVVSYPKSGRTWLRVMLSRYSQLRYGIPERFILGFDNYLRDYTGEGETRASFRDKRMVLLVRSPQDVVTSSYSQWKFCTRADKKELNQLPPHGVAISMFDFAMTNSIGLPRIAGEAVEFASVSKSRSREAQTPLSAARGKLKPGERSNPDSYKARRARVGGYRDDFESEELQRIDDYVRTHFEPGFGYESESIATTDDAVKSETA